MTLDISNTIMNDPLNRSMAGDDLSVMEGTKGALEGGSHEVRAKILAADSSSSPYITEIARSLFGPSIGLCLGDYSCSYNRQSGRLYASSNAICFYSNLFGFERRLSLQMTEVTEIVPLKNSSLCVKTIDCEDHVFRSFDDRDAVLKILLRLYSRLKSDSSMSVVSAPAATPSTTRTRPKLDARSNSFQVRSKPLSLRMEKRDRASSVSPSRPDRCKHSSLVTKSVRDLKSTLKFRGGQQSIMRRSPSRLGGNRGRQHNRRRSQSFDAADLVSVRANRFPSDYSDESLTDVGGDDMIVDDDTDPGAEWDEVKNATQRTYKETAVEGLVLPCDLDTFYEKFLADDAPYSMEAFQQDKIGDTELVTSKWELDEDGCSFVRTIKFRHPIKIPLGPNSATATREQRYRRFGVYGILLETSTSIEGAPASDSFYVEDQWILEPVEEGTIVLNVNYQTRFKKGTLLKKIIEKSSKNETNEWFAGYSSMLQTALGQQAEMTTTKRRPQLTTIPEKLAPLSQSLKEKEPAREVTVDNMPRLFLYIYVAASVATILIITLTLYVVWLHATVISLQKELIQLSQANIETFQEMRQAVNLLQQQMQK